MFTPEDDAVELPVLIYLTHNKWTASISARVGGFNQYYLCSVKLSRKYSIGRVLPVLVQMSGEKSLTLPVTIRDLKKIFIHKNERKHLRTALSDYESVTVGVES